MRTGAKDNIDNTRTVRLYGGPNDGATESVRPGCRAVFSYTARAWDKRVFYVHESISDKEATRRFSHETWGTPTIDWFYSGSND